MAVTRLYACISKATKKRLESHVSMHRVKKGKFIEEVLLHHLKALREPPADLIISPNPTIKRQTFEQIDRLVSRRRKPKKAPRAHMSDKQAP